MTRMFWTARTILAIGLGLALSSARLSAQFIGYTSPQTVVQSVATNLACTGLPQSFPINNLGQTQHFLAVTSTATQTLLARIEGIRNGVTYRMSDTMLPVGLGNSGVLIASGFFPQIQVTITCTPAVTGTFTAGYTGTWGTPIPDVGDYLLTSIDRKILTGAPANVNASALFETPYGNSAGSIVTRYTGAVAGGGTISVTCSTNLTVNVIMTGNLAATTSSQTFVVPASACPRVNVAFGNSGAAGIVDIEYVFSKPGYSNIQCLNSFSAVVGTGTTVKLITLSAPAHIHVCSYAVEVAGPSITTATSLFISGTGATCGTATATLWRLKNGIGGATNDTFQPHQLSAPSGSQLFETALNNQDLCYTDGGTAVGSVVNGTYAVY